MCEKEQMVVDAAEYHRLKYLDKTVKTFLKVRKMSEYYTLELMDMHFIGYLDSLYQSQMRSEV